MLNGSSIRLRITQIMFQIKHRISHFLPQFIHNMNNCIINIKF